MDLQPPDEDEYPTMARAELAIRTHAKEHGYGITKVKDIPNKRKPPTTRCQIFRCAKGGKQRGEGVKRQTGTRMTACPFDVRSYRTESGTWEVRVKNPDHNHEAADASAFPKHREASDTQKQSIRSLHFSGVAPRFIQAELLQRDPECLITLRDIYNEIAKARKERVGDLSSIEALVMELTNDDSWAFSYSTDDEGSVNFVFFAPSEAIDIAQASPDVIFIDATYRTNRYNMPLIHFLVVTAIGNTASVGMCFVRSEDEASYRKALKTFKDLVIGEAFVEVFLTDDEISLKSAIDIFFPGRPQLLCLWHINKNVEKEVNKTWKVNAQGASKEQNQKNQELRQGFLAAWNKASLKDGDGNSLTTYEFYTNYALGRLLKNRGASRGQLSRAQGSISRSTRPP
jgi:MULE transposase domain